MLVKRRKEFVFFVLVFMALSQLFFSLFNVLPRFAHFTQSFLAVGGDYRFFAPDSNWKSTILSARFILELRDGKKETLSFGEIFPSTWPRVPRYQYGLYQELGNPQKLNLEAKKLADRIKEKRSDVVRVKIQFKAQSLLEKNPDLTEGEIFFENTF